jgi:hypothetical protein
MKLSGRFDITNRAMGGVAELSNSMVERTSDGAMLTTNRRIYDLFCLGPSLLCRCSLLGREFGRQADHDSLFRRRSVGSLERLRILGDRLLAGHGFEVANIVL